jgi:hypothetical protein
MRVFIIEAYGGINGVNGSIPQFTVLAHDATEAIQTIQASQSARRFQHFEVVGEGDEYEADEPVILAQELSRPET